MLKSNLCDSYCLYGYGTQFKVWFPPYRRKATARYLHIRTTTRTRSYIEISAENSSLCWNEPITELKKGQRSCDLLNSSIESNFTLKFLYRIGSWAPKSQKNKARWATCQENVDSKVTGLMTKEAIPFCHQSFKNLCSCDVPIVMPLIVLYHCEVEVHH